MSAYDSSDDHQPVMWLRGQALHAAHFIVLVYVASMLLTTGFMAFGVTAPLAWLSFDSTAVLRGQAWRVLTYGFVNPPSLWFVVDMFMIVWFGREVEKFFGRRIFLTLFGCLYLLTPLLFTVIGLRWPMRLAGDSSSFAIFIAFATLYPGVALIFNILAQWMAIILVATYTLIALAYRDMPGLISLWATSGFAFGFVRYQQGRLALPRLRFWSRKSPPVGRAPKTSAVRSEPMAEMDALLDKIARSGMGSLTAKERAKLEQSRAELLRSRGATKN